MILWLASYPRSGNTYFRILLNHFYGIQTTSLYREKILYGEFKSFGFYPLSQPLEKIITKKKFFWIKSHELPSDDCPSIYLVRDGRDVLLSYTWYILTLEKPRSQIDPPLFWQTFHDLIIDKRYFGGWSSHVLAWKRRKAPTALVKFEDIINNPHPLTMIKQACCTIEYNIVGKISPQSLPSFSDLHQKMPNFFRQGQIGAWKTQMPPKLHDLFWQYHGNAMHEMGYTRDIPNYSELPIEQQAYLLPLYDEELRTMEMIIRSQKEYLFAKEQTIQEKEKTIQQLHAAAEQRLQILHTQHSTLLTKEQLIQTQQNELIAKEQLIQAQQSELSVKEQFIQTQQSELSVKEQFIQTQQNELIAKEQLIQAQQSELIAKEEVIQSLIIFRNSSLYYRCIHQPKIFLKRVLPISIQESIRRLRRKFQPKLGQFYQYQPIPLHIPKQYRVLLPPTRHTSSVISVVTPSFNHACFVERTIKSVLDQCYPGLEYIVQDGASNDETPEILEKYRQSLTHLESRRDRGQAHAINLGFRHASGEIMAWLNSDDILLPGTLAYIAKFFHEHPEVDVVYGHRIIIDEDDQEVGRWVLPPHDDHVLLWADYVPQETLFWRRRIWEKAGGYVDESYHFALDWELLLRFYDAGATFVRLPRFLAGFRVHEEQKTCRELDGRGLQEMSRLRKQRHGRDISTAEALHHIRSYMRKHVLYHAFYRAGLLKY